MTHDAASGTPEAAPSQRSWRMLGVVLGVAALVWLGDFLAKEWVIASMTEGERREVLGELLQWHFVRNPGAAFSLAAGSTWIFTILAAGVVVFIATQTRRIRSPLWAAAFGALLGGTLGNLTDRLFREPGFFVGHVVDFISVWGFPAIFNLADVAIVSSMGLFLILTLRGTGLDGSHSPRHPAKAEEAPEAHG